MIDTIIEYLQHPFWMLWGGLVFFFVLKWSFMRNRGKVNGDRSFWEDQKDEIAVSVIGGLCFLVWDDEMISVFFFVKDYIQSGELDFNRQHHFEFPTFIYLIVGPGIDQLLYRPYKALTKQK